VTQPEDRVVLPLIACTLDGQSQVDRVAQWRELARAGLRTAESAPGRLFLRYELSEPQQERLRELAAGETSCCGFARFEVSTAGREATLRVTGPAGTERFFDFMTDRG
jgi:hypothetical protein